MLLRDLDIDPRVAEVVEGQGIEELWPPQAEAIGPVLDGRNTVLAIPTASGKSLVAYLGVVKSVLEGGKALYIVPLRALAAEKHQDLKAFESLGIRVALSMGDYDSDEPTLQSYDVIIATSEKADSLLRHRTHWLKQLSVVVADEVHLLHDADRGPTLEVTLAKLRQVNPRVQVIALSATIANSDELADWLDAVHVQSEWRPVPLQEGVYFDGSITYADLSHKVLAPESDEMATLVRDTLREEGQCLIFVNTRKSTETLARKLRAAVQPYLKREEVATLAAAADRIIGRQEETTSLASRLARDLKAGTAFHHAGLTNQHRKVVEDLFREHDLKVIAATPTLCLHPDTLITTTKGPVRISDLAEGDRVLTHRGRFRKVLGTSRRKFEGELLRVKADGMFPVLMTSEHRVLRNTRYRYGHHGKNGTWHEIRRSETDWIKARDLEPGDEVVSPVEVPPKQGDGGLPSLRIHGEEFVGRNQFGSVFPHPTARPVPQEIPFDERTARLFGLYVAEGFTGRNGVVGFAIATYEEDLTSFIESCMQDVFRCVPRVTDDTRHRRRVRCCSRVLAKFFNRSFGRGAVNKHFPEEWVHAPLEIVRGLVQGAFLGDGSLSPGGWKYARYATVSPRLAEQMQRMLKRLGYMPSVRTTKPKGIGTHPQYRLSLAGRQGRHFLTQVMDVDPAEIRRGNRGYNTKNQVDGSFRSPVRRIRSVPYRGDVYNLHVEGDESYVCSFAFAVHNSAGINLPARRVVVRDVRRFDPNFGYDYIPVLEVKQMCGRAGRPGYDDRGEALLVARHEEDIDALLENYVLAPPEAIESKLGSEPALRMHLLAAVATGHVQTEKELHAFMERTFFAHQRDLYTIEASIERVLAFLEREEFLRREEVLRPTLFGRRTSDLYIDPLSAVVIREALQSPVAGDALAYLHAVAATPDMPTLYLRRKDYEWVPERAEEAKVLVQPDDEEFFLAEVKTAALLEAWIDEVSEDDITSKFRCGPGDIRRLVGMADWLLYAMHELGRLFNKKRMKPLARLLPRLRYGVKEELLDLVSLRGVGRVRARALFERGLRTQEDLREVDVQRLANVPTIGPTVARSILDQLGRQAAAVEEDEDAGREGQAALYDFE